VLIFRLAQKSHRYFAEQTSINVKLKFLITMKTNMNKVELIGFAGMNPEVREISNNAKIAQFSLATSESYRDKTGAWVNNTSWHRIVLWNNIADKAAEEINKGAKVNIIGKIQYRTFETASEEKRNVTEIVATEYKVLPRE